MKYLNTSLIFLLLLYGCLAYEPVSHKKTHSSQNKSANESSSTIAVGTAGHKLFSASDIEKAPKVRLLKVIDGDSLLVLQASKKFQVRLIGIDAPEISMTKKTMSDLKKNKLDFRTNSQLGQKSKQHLSKLIKKDSELKLISDTNSHDHYGRMMAYVLDKDKQFINLKMLQDGYAKDYSVAPNLRFADLFRHTVKQAKKASAGLWAELKGTESNATLLLLNH